MSLRARIVTLLGAVMLVSVLLGVTLAGLEARRALTDELLAGLAGGRQTVESAFEDLPRSDHPQRDLRQLVGTFNGNRHVVALLVDANGRVVARSKPVVAGRPAPVWFAQLLGPGPAPVDIVVPPAGAGAGRLRLTVTSGPDINAIWAEASLPLALVLGSSILSLAFVYLSIGAALRPLRALPIAFARIGEGDYGRQVAEIGPPEVIRLQRAFNQMTDQLDVMRRRNLALESQIVTIQDEERADVARDLHDDMGPHLFAVKVDAQLIASRLSIQPDPEIAGRVKSIQDTVGHMQMLVRELLSRLRPTAATELGLQPAIRDLIAFWRTRRPGIVIETELADERGLDDALKDTIFRVIQEAMTNAMRHSKASRVRVRITRGETAVDVEISDNGAPLVPTTGERGFGLIGLRERVASSGGELAIEGGDRGGGWKVHARLPLPDRQVAETTT